MLQDLFTMEINGKMSGGLNTFASNCILKRLDMFHPISRHCIGRYDERGTKNSNCKSKINRKLRLPRNGKSLEKAPIKECNTKIPNQSSKDNKMFKDRKNRKPQPGHQYPSKNSPNPNYPSLT